jgi:hypothetical protein
MANEVTAFVVRSRRDPRLPLLILNGRTDHLRGFFWRSRAEAGHVF